MTDKEKVLPKLSSMEIEEIIDPPIGHSYRIQLGRLGMENLEQVVLAQRDADLEILERDYISRERVKPLVEAAQEALDEAPWRPLHGEIKDKLREALAQLEEKPRHD